MNVPMNREQKRMLQRRGALTDKGTPAPPEPRQRATTQAPGQKRVGPIQFLREVNTELRRVAWPSRAETINYSVIVLICLAVLIAGLFVVDYGWAKSALFLFE